MFLEPYLGVPLLLYLLGYFYYKDDVLYANAR